ncbi:MAG: energy-coupling factor transporter transmembrane protein EcfT [Lachnospiraceae bacterium]|nr:energy-coupling factor transporter transmembrane protein EcfT [Lachnospiraceae bacterium]
MRINTLGMYYDGGSVIHRLNPLIKLIFVFAYVISLSFISDLKIYLIYTGVLLLLYLISKVPLTYAFRSLRGIIWMLIFTFIMDIFFTKGDVIFKLHFLTITKEGLLLGTRVCLKFMLFFMASALMTYTTTIDEIASTLYKLLKPLEKIKFPAADVVLVITIALRFIPIITEEYEKAYLALKSRGAFDRGTNVFQMVLAMGKVIKVLFISAIRRAVDISNAMEARCYVRG